MSRSAREAGGEQQGFSGELLNAGQESVCPSEQLYINHFVPRSALGIPAGLTPAADQAFSAGMDQRLASMPSQRCRPNFSCRVDE
jgi:hypothetical protein